MTSITITATGGNVTVNGQPLDVGSSRGVSTPCDIDGDGEFYMACNALPKVPSGRMLERPTYDEEGNETGVEEYAEMVGQEPVSVTVYDRLGEICVVEQDTRFPYEGSFPILRPVRVE